MINKIQKLIVLANSLDKQGKHKEADLLDRQIKRQFMLFKLAEEDEEDETEYSYSITYSSDWASEDDPDGEDYSGTHEEDKGYEVENVKGTLDEIAREAEQHGCTEFSDQPYPSNPTRGWWNSVDPVQDDDFFRKGINKHYSFHAEGTDEEKVKINNYLHEYFKKRYRRASRYKPSPKENSQPKGAKENQWRCGGCGEGIDGGVVFSCGSCGAKSHQACLPEMDKGGKTIKKPKCHSCCDYNMSRIENGKPAGHDTGWYPKHVNDP